jgi:hypothetical protein
VVVNVVDRLCDKIKGKGHCVYMDRWFSSPDIFDHLWGCKTNAAGTFSGKLKKGKKYHTNRITSWPSSRRTSVMSLT